MDSPETSNISCRANPISPTGVKKRTSVWIIFLEQCEEVIITWSDLVTHDPNGMIQPALDQRLFQFLEDEGDHLHLPSGFYRVHSSWCLKVRLGNLPFTSMNRLIMVAACLRVSPVANSWFIEPESSSRISLLWSIGKTARLEILPIATPNCALTKSQSQSMYQRRDRDHKYDNENICFMLGRKKWRSLIWWSNL